MSAHKGQATTKQEPLFLLVQSLSSPVGKGSDIHHVRLPLEQVPLRPIRTSEVPGNIFTIPASATPGLLFLQHLLPTLDARSCTGPGILLQPEARGLSSSRAPARPSSRRTLRRVSWLFGSLLSWILCRSARARVGSTASRRAAALLAWPRAPALFGQQVGQA